LETGSIMRPRIFISMSIVPPKDGKAKNEDRKTGGRQTPDAGATKARPTDYSGPLEPP